MNIGTMIQGFTVKRTRYLPELEANLWEMEHMKTGAQLCWLDRADENKAFSIAFKTVPEDSTGVFHILEHSVLCGSRKYPVKEPFVELLKSSVQTFLNAMTFPDKTVYPVSSRNDQNLLNLMDIYLDAVLHPAIYHKPEIFRQEGWRYELGEQTIYQGVVFNEMKGAFGSPARVLDSQMHKMLFPDTCYRQFCAADPSLIGFILSSVSSLDPLRNTASKISVAETRYFKGTTYEDIYRLYSELIHTRVEDLLVLCDGLDCIAKENAVCVVAGQSHLDGCGEKLSGRKSV